MATFEFINDVPLETSIPHGDVPLESILCTEELRRRPWRSRECDEDIHPKRLAAVPWAAYCIQCQEAVDRNLEEFQAPGRDFLERAA